MKEEDEDTTLYNRIICLLVWQMIHLIQSPGHVINHNSLALFSTPQHPLFRFQDDSKI